MKITEVSIKLEPNEHEIAMGSVIRVIKRLPDKQWVVETSDGKSGLFSYEIQIITNMQVSVINAYKVPS